MKTYTVLALLFASPVFAGVFPDVGYAAPQNWNGKQFVLSQNYPQAEPPAESYPWTSIDFKTQPKEYLNSIIRYCFEGFLKEGEFLQPQENTKRPWYHAPWLHYGSNGREFVNGLTNERSSRPSELSEGQTESYRNVAVGLYNDRGAFTIGQVWKNPTAPNAAAAKFPEGTVSFKLLFTAAPETIAPWLAGSPTWTADLDRSNNSAKIAATKVRLLQVDVAVKDQRSSCGGWVFGTFHYDNSIPGDSPWQKLRPLTVLWGNDPTVTPSSGTKPVESWVDAESPIVKFRANPPAGLTPPPPPVLGWAGRGNGPVDNPISSCLSCHSTAQNPGTPMIPPSSVSEQTRLRWFRNLKPGQPFNSNATTLDFSLQLAVGINNLGDFKTFTQNLGGVFVKPKAATPGPAAAAPALAPDAKKPEYSRDPKPVQ